MIENHARYGAETAYDPDEEGYEDDEATDDLGNEVEDEETEEEEREEGISSLDKEGRTG